MIVFDGGSVDEIGVKLLRLQAPWLHLIVVIFPIKMVIVWQPAQF